MLGGSIFQAVIIMVTLRLFEYECEVHIGRHKTQSAALVVVCHVGLGEADSWVHALGDMELDTSQGQRDKASGGIR